jgi:Tat protein translocase TatB subunit
MFGIGMPELMVILIVALLVLGPKRLPEVAKALGKAVAELRRATTDLTDELRHAQTMLEEESRKATSVEPPKSSPARPADAEARPQPVSGEANATSASRADQRTTNEPAAAEPPTDAKGEGAGELRLRS